MPLGEGLEAGEVSEARRADVAAVRTVSAVGDEVNTELACGKGRGEGGGEGRGEGV